MKSFIATCATPSTNLHIHSQRWPGIWNKQYRSKLLKVYFNGHTIEKTLKLDWESQAFLWDESEPGAVNRNVPAIFSEITSTGQPPVHRYHRYVQP